MKGQFFGKWIEKYEKVKCEKRENSVKLGVLVWFANWAKSYICKGVLQLSGAENVVQFD